MAVKLYNIGPVTDFTANGCKSVKLILCKFTEKRNLQKSSPVIKI
jgi:hypothetical protein